MRYVVKCEREGLAEGRPARENSAAPPGRARRLLGDGWPPPEGHSPTTGIGIRITRKRPLDGMQPVPEN
jgi:hypothetical protein